MNNEEHDERQLMERIGVLSEDLIQAEISQLNQLRESAIRHARQLIYLVITGSILALGLLAAAFFLARREFRRSKILVQQLHDSSREIELINQLGNSLQSCESSQDAATVIHHYMQLLFPGVSGGVYLMHASRNLLHLGAEWHPDSDTRLTDPIEPQDCWGLRLGKSHLVGNSTDSMQCVHTQQTAAGSGYCCIPMMAQSDIVGMLHIQSSDTPTLEAMFARGNARLAYRRLNRQPESAREAAHAEYPRSAD